MKRDPRTSSRYQAARRAYLAAHPPGVPCALCGRPVDTSLPGMATWGPTIEHRIPVRRLRQAADSWERLVELTCDTSMWAVAHSHCQKRQGGASTVERAPTRSRW